MNLIDAFIGEHAVLYSLFDHYEETLEDLASLEEVKRVAVVLGAVVDSHSEVEEELLLKHLDRYMTPMGSLEVVRSEHDELAAITAAIAESTDKDAAVTKLSEVIQRSRHHFSKEEHVLFPIIRRSFDEATLIELGDEWAERRVVLL